MLKYKNLTILGTSHIAIQSIKQVRNYITKNKPDIIAIELDKSRLMALISNEKRRITILDIKKIGFKGYFFNLIGALIEKKLGKLVGISPGAEMKEAVKLAKENKLKIALIDQNIDITLKKFSKAITWKEKFNFIKDIISGPFQKQKIKIDLTKVPSKNLIKIVIEKVKERYPSVYNVLIKDRNNIMAKNLYKLITQNKDHKIFAIIGAGHEIEILEDIKRYDNQF